MAAVAACFAIGDANASHPDIFRSFRFIPSRSTLEVTGGFAGIEETFHARGTFDLITGFEEGVSCDALGCPPTPTHIPFAQFENVDAWLIPDSPLAYVWDLDNTLNLSGLNGTFELGSPNRFFFRGVEGQDQPFRLKAVLDGRLLHMFGENDEGCCDFFHYKFKALAYLTPHADSNLDGTVDAADYVASRKGLGQTSTGFGGGATAGSDYDLWRTDFGVSVDFDEFLAADAFSAAVPEPSSLVLLLITALSLAARCQRRAIECSR
jgi:hypothetical protein